MKTVFNIVLGLCALVLVYICYASIMGPINFEKAKKHRDAAVIARLIDIRKAQLEYRGLHNQQYTASFDTLIDFVKNQKLPFIFKQGELDDKQLEDGLTEKKAINIINKAKKTGNYAEVKKWGLENFKRDTMWVAVLDTIFPKGFNADSMRYVPFGNGAQFEHVIALCRDLFSKKLHDYGPAWRILRPASVTDQIFIKANRIRSIETKGVTLVDEGIRSEFIAIVNYGIVGLIQLELGYAESADISNEEAMTLYDKYAQAALELMLAKNHDYDEAWRSMRVSSYTDLILMKIYRTKQIESLSGNTLVSEGIDANYMDMINYSVFGLIKIEFEG